MTTVDALRPWLQAFPYRVSRYNEEYIRVQIAAAKENGGNGWCLWNPTCRYTVALKAIRPQEQISLPAALAALDPREETSPEQVPSADDPNPALTVPAQSLASGMAFPAAALVSRDK